MSDINPEEDLFVDQILDLLNESTDAEEVINDSNEEPIEINTKSDSNGIQLIDENEDIFSAKHNTNDKSVDKSKVEELFGEISDEEFDSKPYLTPEGKQIADNLKTNGSQSISLFETKTNSKSKSFWNKKPKNTDSNANEEAIKDIFSGIRLINPLISSQRMSELMKSRKMVKMSLIKTSINKTTNDIDGDWVTIGVVIGKVAPKVSKNGKQYSIWKLSDLKTKNVVTFFLFGDVYSQHWKLPISSVIGLLNPRIMSDEKDSKYNSKNEICSLTVDHSAKVLVMGTAKDLGYCKAIKKNQEICGALINLADEDYCVYHIKTCYKKFSSKRAEIQTTFSNVGPKNFSINENNNLFSSSFGDSESKDMPIIETKKFNVTQLKNKRDKELETLSKIMKNPISKAAINLSLSMTETKEEIKRAKSTVISAKDVFNSIKREKNNLGFTQFSVPTLAKGYKSGQMIDLSSKSDSKLKAIQLLKAKPLQTEDPNSIKKKQNKRSLEKIISKIDSELKNSGDYEESEDERKAKKSKNDLIERALNRKSINDNEVEIAEMKAQNKYFSVLEKKEKMEEKMSQTYEMECDVISCHSCKYTAHSGSELCKKNGHKLVRHKATKRFFKCKNCQNRSFTFNILMPTKACSKCGQTSYSKTSMIKIKEETSLLDKKLMIRGEESMFLNSLR